MIQLEDVPAMELAGEVRQVDPLIDRRWRAFVDQHPDALVYHHPAWLHCLAAEYDRRPDGLLYVDTSGQVLGVLPLMRTDGVPFFRGAQRAGRRISSLPRTPVAGVLAVTAGAAKALMAAAVHRARASRGARLEIKTWDERLSSVAPELTRVRWRASYTLELPNDPARVRFGNARNHGRIRWSVNKALKCGVHVRRAESLGDLRAWYALYLETMRWHCLPPRPLRLFESMWRLLAPEGKMRLLLAEQRGEEGTRLLAGSVLLMHGGTVFYAFNGRHREDLAFRPNDLIQWQAIHDACAEGFRRYDFGEVAGNHEGLARFKSKWGIEPSWLYRYYYPAPSSVDSGEFREPGPLLRSMQSVWRHVPLRLTAVVGDRVYRYL